MLTKFSRQTREESQNVFSYTGNCLSRLISVTNFARFDNLAKCVVVNVTKIHATCISHASSRRLIENDLTEKNHNSQETGLFDIHVLNKDTNQDQVNIKGSFTLDKHH